ncbi:ankyrin repeat domain-containing protein [Flavobacterium sp. XS2P39]|uniref:ankyrin repeat domain-containing protein n=1 Tax=Flavobacterium sp. XS2P39 TaxID=3401725 RepID=UPI003AAC8F1E
MKKSIVYLGIALVAFSTVSQASNYNSLPQKESTHSGYEESTLLCVAICKGDINLVKKLIDYGADVNEKSNGLTPLMMAARYNKVEIIKLLLAKGAQIKEKNDIGITALKYAELSNAKEAVAFLKASMLSAVVSR